MPGMLRAKGVVLLGLACTVFGYGTHAEACGAIGCVRSTDVLPADGSANVPLNAEIRVRSLACDEDLDAVRLQPESGDPISLSGDLLEHSGDYNVWFVARPDEPLTASTRYQVQRRFDPMNDGALADDDTEWVTISTFETGAATDVDAPSFAGITALRYGETVDHWAGCGSRDVIELEPSFTLASDTFAVSDGVTNVGSASPALRYNVYVDGVLAVPYSIDLLHDPFGEMFVDCGAQALQVATLITPGASIEVRAVDLAGNESDAHDALPLDLYCTVADDVAPSVETSEPVLPAPSRGDATPSIASDEPSQQPSISRGPGCALPVRDPSATSPALWPLLALLLPALRRLRARNDSRSPRRT